MVGGWPCQWLQHLEAHNTVGWNLNSWRKTDDGLDRLLNKSFSHKASRKKTDVNFSQSSLVCKDRTKDVWQTLVFTIRLIFSSLESKFQVLRLLPACREHLAAAARAALATPLDVPLFKTCLRWSMIGLGLGIGEFGGLRLKSMAMQVRILVKSPGWAGRAFWIRTCGLNQDSWNKVLVGHTPKIYQQVQEIGGQDSAKIDEIESLDLLLGIIFGWWSHDCWSETTESQSLEYPEVLSNRHASLNTFISFDVHCLIFS